MLLRPACTFFCFCKVAFLAVLLVFLCVSACFEGYGWGDQGRLPGFSCVFVCFYLFSRWVRRSFRIQLQRLCSFHRFSVQASSAFSEKWVLPAEKEGFQGTLSRLVLTKRVFLQVFVIQLGLFCGFFAYSCSGFAVSIDFVYRLRVLSWKSEFCQQKSTVFRVRFQGLC